MGYRVDHTPFLPLLCRAAELRQGLYARLALDVTAPHEVAVAGAGDGHGLLPELPVAAKLLTRREVLAGHLGLEFAASLGIEELLREARSVLSEVGLDGAVVGLFLQIDQAIDGRDHVFSNLLVVIEEELGVRAEGDLQSVVVFGFEDVSDRVVRRQFPPARLDRARAKVTMATTSQLHIVL